MTTLSGSFKAKQPRSPAKIRIEAAVKNQPRLHNQSKNNNESDQPSQRSNSMNAPSMSSLERLEPYLKNQTPIKPMKNFVSTVSYLRPATENKYVNPDIANGG